MTRELGFFFASCLHLSNFNYQRSHNGQVGQTLYQQVMNEELLYFFVKGCLSVILSKAPSYLADHVPYDFAVAGHTGPQA